MDAKFVVRWACGERSGGIFYVGLLSQDTICEILNDEIGIFRIFEPIVVGTLESHIMCQFDN